jgi:purine-binding chemotaxis protein CheW
MKKTSKEILRERAIKLGQTEEEKGSRERYIEVVIFKLEKEFYAIEPRYIQEIFTLKDVTFLPNAPSFIYGLVNVRRKVITIIDLKKIFELSSPVTSSARAMIIQNNTLNLALLIDAICGMQNILLKDIQPPIPTLTGIRQELLRGITNDGLVILDGEKLLSHKEIVGTGLIQELA